MTLYTGEMKEIINQLFLFLRDFIKDGTPGKVTDCENDYACVV